MASKDRDPVALKESFLEENQLFTEAELDDKSIAIGKLDDIDEVWLLQCPKGMDVKQWQSEKLKIPGRTNLSSSEALAVEFIDGKKQHAFAYCNRKGRYALRLLPVRGTIVLRNHLKVADTITAERIEECCPPSKRVPMPSAIRLRHPLLGFQYEEKLGLGKHIVDRLHEADEVSAEILRESLTKKMTGQPRKSTRKVGLNTTRVVMDTEEDDNDDVQLVSEELTKSKKTKRTHSESKTTDNPPGKKKKNATKNEDGEVSKDLQWLQNI